MAYVEPCRGCKTSGHATGAGAMEKTMNVLELVRKQTNKKTARKAAQTASLKAQSIALVYRGVPYQISK